MMLVFALASRARRAIRQRQPRGGHGKESFLSEQLYRLATKTVADDRNRMPLFWTRILAADGPERNVFFHIAFPCTIVADAKRSAVVQPVTSWVMSLAL
jgi:hypothetical protein